MSAPGYTPEEPIAAIATALAPGAIGIVRVSGTGCIALMEPLFSRPAALRGAAGTSLVHGWITVPESGERLDEVMLGVYRSPKSFTGEDMVEIFCHGGLAVVSAIQRLLLAHGFRQAERGEFTFRSYINGKNDLTKAEAVKEIIDSRTDESRGKAAGRLAGNLFAEIDAIKKLVVDTLASIEVEIEYPEDEETVADSFDRTALAQAESRLSSLVHSWKSEKLYQDGARLVLCGRTNAGKSSLFNALLKEDRSIVSDVEGTTRDWLESWASFDGIPVRLFDTAGLRRTDDLVEAEGVERTRSLSSMADLILYVVDAGGGLSADDETFLASQQEIPAVLVWNKCDKADALPLPPDNAAWKAAIALSAWNGSGIGALVSAVKSLLTEDAGGSRSGAALGSERQRLAVSEALERVSHALRISRNHAYGLDAVVQDLEDSLVSLGEVTGEVTPDDVLGSIFSRFCVGK